MNCPLQAMLSPSSATPTINLEEADISEAELTELPPARCSSETLKPANRQAMV